MCEKSGQVSAEWRDVQKRGNVCEMQCNEEEGERPRPSGAEVRSNRRGCVTTAGREAGMPNPARCGTRSARRGPYRMRRSGSPAAQRSRRAPQARPTAPRAERRPAQTCTRAWVRDGARTSVAGRECPPGDGRRAD
jgi:hypothetical protein